MKHPASCAYWGNWLALLALACGDENVTITRLPAPPPVPDAPTPAPPTGVADERESLELSLQRDPLAQGVVRALQDACGGCHGGERSDGGLGEVANLAAQIALGNIVPGAAAQSPLLQRILDGSMPPPRQLPLPPGQIALLGRFIDQLPAAPAAACEALPFQSTDALYAALLADSTSAPVTARPFLRYVGLTYASNAGWCGAALERQRAALFKLVNSVSSGPDVVVPRAIDEHELAYRIDLRDYRWERSISRESEGAAPYASGWDAIVASAGAYALELGGADADELKRQTGTKVPYLPAHALLHAAAGEAYSSLLGLPDTFYEAEAALGVVADPGLGDQVQHAGYASARASYVVRRFEQGSHPGRHYWLIDAWDRGRSASPFDDPFDFGYDAPLDALFHLPNGLLAYLAERSPRAPDASNGHSPGRETASCSACHQAGILPVTDSIRRFVEDNAELFDRETFAAVLRNYPLPAELELLILADNQLHTSASELARVSPNGPDPLSYVYSQFELDPLSLPRVAAELSVTPEELLGQLPRLDARLQALQEPGGSVSRSVLDKAFGPSSCILQAAARNRPVSCP